jgi:NADH:ubiquinone oxidoreductase subunit 4 (subunit M)
MRASRKEVPVAPVPFALGAALACCLVTTIYFGVLPDRVLQFTQDSAQQLVQQAAPEIPSSTAVSVVPGKL